MSAIRRVSEALTRRPDLVLWLIAAYYVLAIVLRVLRSEAVESDEAEQLFQSQFWLMGYGRQPPFYNWLQTAVIDVIGPSVFALSLVKNLLLFLTCVFYGLAARLLLKDMRLVAVAMLGVIAMPAVSVMAQRDLTHAIATLFAVSLFTYAFFSTLIRPNLGFYLLTGFAVGIGLIAKYNFVIVPVAAILAILPEPDLRRRIFDWRFIPALLVVVIICLPHGLWVLSNLTDATAGTIKAMREDASGNAVLDRLSGLGALILAMLTGGLPIFAFFLVAFRRSLVTAWSTKTLWTRVVGRMLLLCLISVGMIGLGLGATSISEKWLSPFLLLLPFYLCLKLEAAKTDTNLAVPRLFFPVAALALGFIAYIAIGNRIGPFLNQYEKENLPAGLFIEQVVAERGERPAYVTAADPFLAASARIELPDARIFLPTFDQAPPLDAAIRGKPGLVIWQIGRKGGEAMMPEALASYLRARGIAPETLSSSAMAVPYLYSGGRADITFGAAWIDAH